jgi:hypothetical protein
MVSIPDRRLSEGTPDFSFGVRLRERSAPGSSGSISRHPRRKSRPTRLVGFGITPPVAQIAPNSGSESGAPSRRSALPAASHTARLRQAAVGRVRSQELPELARWNRGSMSTSGSTFRDLGIRRSAGVVIPSFTPSIGATVEDGQGPKPLVVDLFGTVGDGQRRLSSHRFWVRSPRCALVERGHGSGELVAVAAARISR